MLACTATDNPTRDRKRRRVSLFHRRWLVSDRGEASQYVKNIKADKRFAFVSGAGGTPERRPCCATMTRTPA
jgi:hypothetical protein